MRRPSLPETEELSRPFAAHWSLRDCRTHQLHKEQRFVILGNETNKTSTALEDGRATGIRNVSN
jgi:hypothetical protein